LVKPGGGMKRSAPAADAFGMLPHTANPTPAPEPAATPSLPEPKGDPLALLAVDANELAKAIWSGKGTDVSRLVTELLRDRPAA